MVFRRFKEFHSVYKRILCLIVQFIHNWNERRTCSVAVNDSKSLDQDLVEVYDSLPPSPLTIPFKVQEQIAAIICTSKKKLTYVSRMCGGRLEEMIVGFCPHICNVSLSRRRSIRSIIYPV